MGAPGKFGAAEKVLNMLLRSVGKVLLTAAITSMANGCSNARAPQLIEKADPSSTAHIYLFQSANIESPWTIGFDTSERWFGYWDSGAPYHLCTTENYYCITGPIHFSVPKKEPHLEIGDKRSWKINDVNFSIEPPPQGSGLCMEEEDLTYLVRARKQRDNTEYQFVYSYRCGITIVNIVYDYPSEREVFFNNLKPLMASDLEGRQ